MFDELRKFENAVWCGDGRFDSMGHSAKYGTYTIFNTTIMKVTNFNVIQVWV